MKTNIEQFERWLKADEDEHLEFKKAENRYDFEELTRYCVALANERGGKFILGVTDKHPRRLMGTRAFQNLERTKAGLVERLHLRIETEQLDIDGKRIVIFHVPPRPIGMPIHYKGSYWMRGGDALMPMSPDQLKRIFDESVPDFSAETCSKATLTDLAPEAIDGFRRRWIQKTGRSGLGNLPVEQLLQDAELIVEGSLTFAALILLGTRKAMGRHLAQAEVVFEYRSGEAPGPAQQRLELGAHDTSCRESSTR
jgi:ATP-dependent DNA helicase RecG